MALTQKDIEALTASQETFEQLVRERLRQAIRLTLIEVLEDARDCDHRRKAV